MLSHRPSRDASPQPTRSSVSVILTNSHYRVVRPEVYCVEVLEISHSWQNTKVLDLCDRSHVKFFCCLPFRKTKQDAKIVNAIRPCIHPRVAVLFDPPSATAPKVPTLP